jgi:hypothetical protein
MVHRLEFKLQLVWKNKLKLELQQVPDAPF